MKVTHNIFKLELTVSLELNSFLHAWTFCKDNIDLNASFLFTQEELQNITVSKHLQYIYRVQTVFNFVDYRN